MPTWVARGSESAAGIKSRATILRGHCRAYGEGMTYWPIAQVLRERAGIRPDEVGETAYAKLETLLGDDGHVTAKVAQVLGLREGAVEREDAYWALQRVLELLAKRRPLVLVIDDFQHARPPLLALVQHIALWSRDSPILLVCLARPELVDARVSRAGHELDAISIKLSPLVGDEAEQLVRSLLYGGTVRTALQEQLSQRAAGYPLFAEELISMLVDDGKLRLSSGGVWETTEPLDQADLPPTLHALLAARLDELPEPERRVLRRASIVGTTFDAAAVNALLPDHEEQEVAAILMALLRKELLLEERDGGDLRNGKGRLRFRHALIREAAYRGTPKELRAELHQRQADWLSAHGEGYADKDGDVVDVVR